MFSQLSVAEWTEENIFIRFLVFVSTGSLAWLKNYIAAVVSMNLQFILNLQVFNLKCLTEII